MRRGEADAFPPPCCRRLLPLARAWTSASFPNHLLPFPQPGPLSGDPLPPPLCPGQSSTAVSRMVVWAGRAVPTALTPAQCLPCFGLHREFPSCSSPVQRSWGGCQPSSSWPCPGPLPQCQSASPPTLGRPGGLSIETFLRPLGQRGLGQVVGAAPSLVACWGFRHLGPVTRQPRWEGWLWLGLALVSAAAEGEA